MIDRIHAVFRDVLLLRRLHIGYQRAQLAFACRLFLVCRRRREQRIDPAFDQLRLQVGVGLIERHARQRHEALAPAGDPSHVRPFDAVLLAENSPRPHRGGHRKVRHADQLTL